MRRFSANERQNTHTDRHSTQTHTAESRVTVQGVVLVTISPCARATKKKPLRRILTRVAAHKRNTNLCPSLFPSLFEGAFFTFPCRAVKTFLQFPSRGDPARWFTFKQMMKWETRAQRAQRENGEKHKKKIKYVEQNPATSTLHNRARCVLHKHLCGVRERG